MIVDPALTAPLFARFAGRRFQAAVFTPPIARHRLQATARRIEIVP